MSGLKKIKINLKM